MKNEVISYFRVTKTYLFSFVKTMISRRQSNDSNRSSSCSPNNRSNQSSGFDESREQTKNSSEIKRRQISPSTDDEIPGNKKQTISNGTMKSCIHIYKRK